MAWFLALQGATQPSHQSSVYELQDSADIDKLAQELVGAVTLDRVVPVPAMLPQNTRKRQKVTLYIRPAAWGLWPGPSVALVAGRSWGIGWLTSACASKVIGGRPKLVP